MAHQFSP